MIWNELEATQAKGVDPTTNWEVAVCESIGPPNLPDVQLEEYCKQLGIEQRDPSAEYFDPRDMPDDNLGSEPWSANDFPASAKWLKANDAAIDKLVHESKRPHCYHPYIPGLRATYSQLGVGKYKQIVQVWYRRALLRLESGVC